MGAMSAEEAGDAVGLSGDTKGKIAKKGCDFYGHSWAPQIFYI